MLNMKDWFLFEVIAEMLEGFSAQRMVGESAQTMLSGK